MNKLFLILILALKALYNDVNSFVIIKIVTLTNIN